MPRPSITGKLEARGELTSSGEPPRPPAPPSVDVLARDFRQVPLPGMEAPEPPIPALRHSPTRGEWRRRLHPLVTCFLIDRAASRWDGGQPLRTGDSVSGRIDHFSPKSLGPERWDRIAPLAREWVADALPDTPSAATAWMNVVTQALAFCDAQGFPLEPAVVFSTDIIEHFVAVGCAHLRSGTRANYRSQLRTVGEQVLGPEACPNRTVSIRASDAAAPYSRAEVASLIAWANGLSTPHQRHNAKVLLALGLGAGLSALDISVLVGTDIDADGSGVLIEVPGPNSRAVPVLHRWEHEIAETARLCGNRPMFRSARERVNRKDISRFIEACRLSDAPKLSIQRTRITWVVHHLTANTPVRALLPAAGIGAKQLARYYPFVEAPELEDARALLRGVQQP